MCKAYFTYHVESPTTSNKLNFVNTAIPINDTDDIWDEQWKAILFDAENAIDNGDSSAIAIYDFWCLLVRKIVVRYNYIFVHLISQIEKEGRDFEPKKGLSYLLKILYPFLGFIDLVQNTFVNDSLCDIPKNVCAIRKKIDSLLSTMFSLSKDDTLLFEMLPKKTMPVFSNLFCLNEQYVEDMLSRVVPVIGFGPYNNDKVLAFVNNLANNLNNRYANQPPIFYIIKQSKNLNDAAQFIYQLNGQINQKEKKLFPIIIIIMVIFNGVELPYVCMQSLDTLEKIQLSLHNMYEIAKMKGD